MAVQELLGKGQQTYYDTIFSVRGNGRKLSSALATRSATSPTKIAFVGDSVTEGLDGSYVEAFKKRLAPLNNGFKKSSGWVHASPGVAPTYSPGGRMALTTGTAGVGGNVEDSHSLTTSGYSLASGSVLTLQNYDGTTFSWYFDTMEFHYTVFGTSGGAGSVTVAIDGANQTAINTVDTAIGAGNYEIRTVTYTVAHGIHTVTVTGSGGQPSIVGGMYLSDGDSIWVYQVGDSGDEFTDMNMSTSGKPIQGLAAIDADAVVWMHGINSFHAGDAAAAATAAGDLDLALTNTVAALPNVTLGVGIMYPAQTRTTWPLFVTEWKRIAANRDAPVCDFSTMLLGPAGTTPTTNDPFDLIHDTGSIAHTHPNPAGAEYMGDQLARFFGFIGIDWVAALGNMLRSDSSPAVFTSTSFGAAITVTKHDTGKAYVLLQDNKDSLSASNGLIGELGMNGRGATGLLGAGGINALAWFRYRTPAAWTDTSAPCDLEFGNCASGSVTAAVRMKLLAGGWLQFPEFAAPAGTTNAPAIGSRLSGGFDQFGVLMPDSTVRVLASSGSGDLEALDNQAAMRPTGIYAETIDRFNVNVANQAVLTSGTLYMVSIGLKTGQKVTNISFWSATTGAGTPTHWLFSLHDTATRALLATSADQTTTAWGANTKKTLAMTSAYTVPTANNYYLALFVVATTVPTLRGIAVDATLAADPPIMNGNSSSTGLTTAAPNPAGAITAGAIRVWAGVS